MRIAGIIENSLSNGEGTRMVIFFSGCCHDCEGCHNEEMKRYTFGEKKSHEEIMEIIKKNIPIITGITLSGGEPFIQAESAYKIAKESKELGLDVWVYTGFLFEDLEKLEGIINGVQSLLDHTDVLIDGKFEKDKLDSNLKYRGSSNQRILRKGSNNVFQQERV